MCETGTDTTGADRHAGNLKLVGGWLCLDFTNTVDWHGSDHPREWLTTYEDLVWWSRHAGALSEPQAASLLQRARQDPEGAEAVRRRAVALREALYRVFLAAAAGRPAAPADLSAVNGELARTSARTRLSDAGGRFSWVWAAEEDALDRMFLPILLSASELLTSADLGRVTHCADDDCGWLFVDMSRNRSRRWCDMRECGNRAKARRHYRKTRGALSSRPVALAPLDSPIPRP